ncbi:MAG: hypothetical protein LIO81_00900 [Clostridiales bacterium]|nr:hypothetical protein [Clostridiales bacterium]
MAQHIFRKKSLERISSPEQLNDYIRVADPPVWMLLGAVILLLVGVCAWGVFGRLETVISAAAVAKDGVATVYIKEENSSVREGMTVRINGNEFIVSSVSAEPVAVSGDLPDYALHVGDLQRGEWVYEALLEEKLPDGASPADDVGLADGVYRSEIVTERVSPISFVVN